MCEVRTRTKQNENGQLNTCAVQLSCIHSALVHLLCCIVLMPSSPHTAPISHPFFHLNNPTQAPQDTYLCGILPSHSRVFSSPTLIPHVVQRNMVRLTPPRVQP